MAHLLWQSLWLALPVTLAGIGHMVVVKARALESLALPIDRGYRWGGRPIFGENKTWRGFVVVLALATCFGALQGAAFGSWAASSGIACIDYGALGRAFRLVPDGWSESAGYALANLVFGAGYVIGELPNSFLKRRLGVGAGLRGAGMLGGAMFVVDQADSVGACLLLAVLAFGASWSIFAVGLVTLSVLHLGVTAALHVFQVKHAL